MSYNYDLNPWDDNYTTGQQQQAAGGGEGPGASGGGQGYGTDNYSNETGYGNQMMNQYSTSGNSGQYQPSQQQAYLYEDSSYNQQQPQQQQQLDSNEAPPPPSQSGDQAQDRSAINRFLRNHVPLFGRVMDTMSAINLPFLDALVQHVNRDLLVSKMFYFFFYSAFGSLFPLMGVYFKQLGMNPAQVGILTGVRPFIEIFSAPFWNSLAERFHKSKALLLFSLLSWIIFTHSLAHIRPPASACVAFNDTDYVLYTPYSSDDLSNFDIGEETYNNNNNNSESLSTTANMKNENEMFMSKMPSSSGGGAHQPITKEREFKGEILASEENQNDQRRRRRKRHALSSSLKPSRNEEGDEEKKKKKQLRYLYQVVADQGSETLNEGEGGYGPRSDLETNLSSESALDLDVDLESDFDDKPLMRQESKQRNIHHGGAWSAFVELDENSEGAGGHAGAGEPDEFEQLFSKTTDGRYKRAAASATSQEKKAKKKVDAELDDMFTGEDDDQSNSNEEEEQQEQSNSSNGEENGEEKVGGEREKPKGWREKGGRGGGADMSEQEEQEREEGEEQEGGSNRRKNKNKNNKNRASSSNNNNNKRMKQKQPTKAAQATTTPTIMTTTTNSASGGESSSSVSSEETKATNEKSSTNDQQQEQQQQQQEASKPTTTTTTRRIFRQRHKTPPTHIVGMSPITVEYAVNYNKEKHKTFVTPMFSTIVYKLDDIKEVFFLLLLLISLGEFFSAPALTLADSATLGYLGENTDLYGRQRMFGSFSWAITLLLVGMALDNATSIADHPCGPHQRERSYTVCFVIFSLLMACAFFTATQFRFNYPKSSKSSSSNMNNNNTSMVMASTTDNNSGTVVTTTVEGDIDQLYASTQPRSIFNTAPPVNGPPQTQQQQQQQDGITKDKFEFLDKWKSAVFAQRTGELPEWINVFRQFRNSLHLTYLFITWFLGCGVGLVFTFLFWHLQDVGGTPTLFGICSVINHISEILAYFFSFSVIKRFGHTRVLSVGLGCNVIRFLYVAFLTNPYYALPFELVQGITHAACFAACCSYISHVSKPELRTSTQGVMQGLHHGIGRACGALLGGYMINAIGSRASFCIYGLLSGCVLAGFLYVRKKATELKDEEVKVDESEALGGYGAPQGVPSAIPGKIGSQNVPTQDINYQW